MRVFKSIRACSAMLVLGSTSAFAGVPQYGPTAEFLNVCDSGSGEQDAVDARFMTENWDSADSDVVEALMPDDFMTKVNSAKGYVVEIQDGGMWLALTAKGQLSTQKYNYCSVTVIDDDPDGYQQDFVHAKNLNLTQVVDIDIEKRFTASGEAGSHYIMREIRSPDINYFTYIKIVPVVAEGN